MAEQQTHVLTKELDNLSLTDEHICINYDDNKCAEVRVVNLLKPLLLDNSEQSVLFVGEENFTFTVAFAALRKSWNGFISTTWSQYDPNSEPQFAEVKLKSIEYCIKNGRQLGISADKILYNTETVINLPTPPEGTWKFGIDATNIPSNSGISVQGRVVWFQCPWVSMRKSQESTATLITTFLEHMASKQSCDDYVLIGIANYFPYIKNYI